MSAEEEKITRVVLSKSREEVVRFGKCFKDKTKEEIQDYYTEWAADGSYEQVLNPNVYTGPSLVAEAISAYFNHRRETVKILDVAAGTGLLGQKLFDKGFRCIDGLDPSDSMLQEARNKGVYSKLLCQFMDGNVSNIKNDVYDCVATTGGMGPGHIPCEAIHEMIRIAKSGGLVCIVMREAFINDVEEYNDRLEPLFKQTETEQKWELISRKVVQNYAYTNNGVIFQYKVL